MRATPSLPRGDCLIARPARRLEFVAGRRDAVILVARCECIGSSYFADVFEKQIMERIQLAASRRPPCPHRFGGTHVRNEQLSLWGGRSIAPIPFRRATCSCKGRGIRLTGVLRFRESNYICIFRSILLFPKLRASIYSSTRIPPAMTDS